MTKPNYHEIIYVTGRYREPRHGKVDVAIVEAAIMARFEKLAARAGAAEFVDIMIEEFAAAEKGITPHGES